MASYKLSYCEMNNRKGSIMLKKSSIFMLSLLLTGCITREQQVEADRQQCYQYGFKRNTYQFSNCMMTISTRRQSMLQKEIADQQDYHQQQELLSALLRANKKEKHDTHHYHNTYDDDKTPQFDRNGYPNYDEDDKYIGCHGVGCLVDSPEVAN